MNKHHASKWIKQRSRELGFSRIGIAKAEELTEEKKQLREWLNRGYHGEMSYMENYFEKRTDPTLLVEGTKSIIVLTYNYHNPAPRHPDSYKISQYAYGKDYHWVMKEKLKTLLADIDREIAPTSGRVFVDSAPVMESEWAQRAGVGWQGKNTLIIHPKAGSYFFLGEVLVDIELAYDQPIQDYCGTCRRCIDACPTDAIDENGYLLDGSKCISFSTIEKKGPIPETFEGKMEDWIFGCDICQEVCPWNRFSTPHDEPAFDPHPDLLSLSKEEWQNLSRERFQELFRKSPVKRTKYEGLKRNIEFIAERESTSETF
ncbi:tRNA epoxyqueuosine(34) reductase QueG [Membranicola marinus]|uniref:Epoxyqueuosine reductase n=1 Tax=Membranihabitans marinus TaxID=1227546 RepID=A0A953HQJ3_9BACT|nr:tRNA epoxyqueuosine(34) reductase QueG [Membranihabitans marinus]MBY5956540.1 tRNA epoxyqueuosine(34) reductase QueG [Membranihabitans marinus]